MAKSESFSRQMQAQNPRYYSDAHPDEPLSLANVDVVFISSLAKVDTNHNGRVDFNELDATTNMEFTDAQRDLFKILRESRETISHLNDRKLLRDNYITTKDMTALQKIGKVGADTWKAAVLQGLENAPENFAWAAGVSGAAAYTNGVRGARNIGTIAMINGAVYAGVSGAFESSDYWINDRKTVGKVLEQLGPHEAGK